MNQKEMPNCINCKKNDMVKPFEENEGWYDCERCHQTFRIFQKTPKFVKDIFKIIEDGKATAILKDENIYCPYCQHEQEHETIYHNTTYWGDEEPKINFCEHCGKSFIVKEIVKRTFESLKIEENKANL